MSDFTIRALVEVRTTIGEVIKSLKQEKINLIGCTFILDRSKSTLDILELFHRDVGPGNFDNLCTVNFDCDWQHEILESTLKRLLINLLLLSLIGLLGPLFYGHAPVMNLSATHGAPCTPVTLCIPSLDARLAKRVTAHEGAVGRILIAHRALHGQFCKFEQVCRLWTNRQDSDKPTGLGQIPGFGPIVFTVRN